MGLFSCKKNNDTIPDHIELSMSVYVSANGNNYPALDSTRLRFVEYHDSSSVIVAYTDSDGKATVVLKRDTEYMFFASSRTYNGPYYYYTKGVWLRSSWTSSNKEKYYQVGWPVYFYPENKQEGTGSSLTTKPDPSL